MAEDFYAVLGIRADVDDVELRRAWRRLAMEWHPDRAGPAATAKFQEMLAAYSVLSDPDARAEYDRQRRAALPTVQVAPRKAPGVMLRRLSRPLDALLALGYARRITPDLIELYLARDEIEEGGMVTISMRVLVHCVRCAGARGTSCGSCGNRRTIDELYSAWLAIRPGVAEGSILEPSAQLPNVVRPVSFRVRYE